MKIRTILAAAAILMGWTANAQEYKVAKATGTLEIREVNEVSIEGYAGNEIIFSSSDNDKGDDDRAKGLKAISSSGVEDNTGLGLSVVDKGGVIEVRQLKKMDGPDIRIKVPKGVKVYYSHTSPYGGDLKIKNFEGEIEVSTVHNGVHLDNVTGKIRVNTVHGEVEAAFTDASKNSMNIESVHGHVDVSIPLATKANLSLGTTFGEIFLDPDFKLEIERKGDLVGYSGNLSAKLNGGSNIDIDLSSAHGNVYLRKK